VVNNRNRNLGLARFRISMTISYSLRLKIAPEAECLDLTGSLQTKLVSDTGMDP
jgi:hypothetical protein